MAYGLTYVGVSLGVLLLLVIFFRFEDKRGRRVVLSGVRNSIDDAVLLSSNAIGSFFETIGSRGTRIVMHFIIHNVLKTILRLLEKSESGITRLLHSNRRKAHVIRESTARTHLHEIADHKVETALTDEEKRKKKTESLG